MLAEVLYNGTFQLRHLLVIYKCFAYCVLYLCPGLYCALQSNPTPGCVTAFTNLMLFSCESSQHNHSKMFTSVAVIQLFFVRRLCRMEGVKIVRYSTFPLLGDLPYQRLQRLCYSLFWITVHDVDGRSGSLGGSA